MKLELRTRPYRGPGSLSLAAAGGLACSRASCRPIASAIRRMRGSSDSPEHDPLSLARQCLLFSSSAAIPTPPSSGPSNEKQRGSAERKSESRAVVAERKETCCWRSLHVGRQYPNTFQRTVVRREGDALPRIGSVLHFLRKSDPNSALSGRTNWRHGPACAQVAETSAAQALLYKHCSHAPASARCATRLFAIVQALWR